MPASRRFAILPLLLSLACADDAGSPASGGSSSGGDESTGTTGGQTSAPGTSESSGGADTTGADESSGEPPVECGDGVVGTDEECDDGDQNDDEGACKSDCTLQACGDGFVGPREGCDDGNDVDDDACSNACIAAECGNGIVDGTDECDDGDANADDAACTAACRVATCGDGLVQSGVEACDDSGETATCDADCSAVECGDGTVNTEAGEVCDTDVGDSTCVLQGFEGGALACATDSCTFDVSSCYNAVDVGFTTCEQTGPTGPSQAQCDTAYAGTDLEGAVSVTAGFQSWTVPYTATYRIEALGARGGTHNFGAGGSGARMQGDFALTQGQVLRIVVGQTGSDGTSYDVGGGGGTFVALADDTPLIVAAGGGGAGNCSGFNSSVLPGLSSIGDGNGGLGGNNGTWCGCGGDGSPGGGFSTNGSPTGGQAFVNGALGDDTERPNQCVDSGLGGFGGGGNGGNGGGGGGGYSGGAAGGSLANAPTGHGGQSYNDGANPEGEDGFNAGPGAVSIVLVP